MADNLEKNTLLFPERDLQSGFTHDELFFMVHYGWNNPRLMGWAAIFFPWVYDEMRQMQLYYEKHVLKGGDA